MSRPIWVVWYNGYYTDDVPFLAAIYETEASAKKYVAAMGGERTRYYSIEQEEMYE